MNKLQQIDNKIIQLKKLKADIETRLAKDLYRKIQGILGEDFTSSLAFVILSETWKSATFKQKEVWHAQANRFPFSGLSGIPQKNTETVKPNAEQQKRNAL